MPDSPVHVTTPRRIAVKFLGGFVPAVAYHYGVLEVLRERGFVLRTGFRAPDAPRESGPPGIDLVVGSSAGAFFMVAACAGATRDDLVGAMGEVMAEATDGAEGRPAFPPFPGRNLGTGKGLTRKALDWLRHGPRAGWSERRSWKAWAAESTINILLPLWTLEPIERYLAEDILGGRQWRDLRTEASILAVDLNHPVTFVLGERQSPVLDLFASSAASPEAIHRILGSEGRRIVADFEQAGVPRDHPALAPFVEDPDRRHTAVFVRDVSMANAAAGSMSSFPFYAPVELRREDGSPLRLGHYTPVVVDGEDRNSFTTDAAEETGCDFVLVSSITAPYKYLHGVGSLAERGYSAIHAQRTGQSRDAKQDDVMRNERLHARLFEDARQILEASGCSGEPVERLHAMFQRRAWIDHRRIRITPDPDIAEESRDLRRLEPLAFTPDAVERAMDLGRRVARRVLAGYRFEFLD